MSYTELMINAASYVRDTYSENKKPELFYHCLAHTENTVAAAEKIADHYQLEEEDYAAVYLSAWFHDIGYLFTTAELHEEKGIDLAAQFILQQGGEESLIAKVKECILATKMPQNPVSLISRIVCDADLFHFGTEDFEATNKQVRKEMEARFGKKIPGKLWRIKALEILNSQKFHTVYCQALLQKGKQVNLERIQKKIEEDNKEQAQKDRKPNTTVESGETNADAEKKKPTRGVETMFRTTSTNHLRLSEMADTKANIMITVNSIIASILVSVLFRKLEEDHRLIIPALMFLITSLVSIVFAILVTR
ncbi:MAG TPA: HD domain-containing protein, partial [Chitinophagaceae bacterium]|nr:HD domain-containing protein [Chitinophagaceae bacterium]